MSSVISDIEPGREMIGNLPRRLSTSIVSKSSLFDQWYSHTIQTRKLPDTVMMGYISKIEHSMNIKCYSFKRCRNSNHIHVDPIDHIIKANKTCVTWHAIYRSNFWEDTLKSHKVSQYASCRIITCTNRHKLRVYNLQDSARSCSLVGKPHKIWRKQQLRSSASWWRYRNRVSHGIRWWFEKKPKEI